MLKIDDVLGQPWTGFTVVVFVMLIPRAEFSLKNDEVA